MQALGLLLLDIDSLDVAVQLLLGAFLVVSLSADAHAQSEGNAFDTALPDLLVQLWVETDVAGSLSERERQVSERLVIGSAHEERFNETRKNFNVTELFGRRLTIDSSANFLISLIALGARFLNDMPWTCGFAKFLISLPSNIHALAKQLHEPSGGL